MRGVVAVASALLLSLAASGCFVEEEDPETQEASGTGGPSGTVSGTGTKAGTKTGSSTATGTSAPGNSPPMVNLTAAPTNGSAPLNVTFTITGSDADGDTLQWVLTLANETLGNGTGLPAQHNHTFAEAGNYTVAVKVNDGTANVTTNITVTVVAGGTGGEAPVDPLLALCPTDEDAVEIPGTGLYTTAMDYVDGQIWIYEESNGMDGLQRGDNTDCPSPDTVIF